LEKWTEKKVYDIGEYRFYGNGRVGYNQMGFAWDDIIEKNITND
jgi:hypothetical protein